MNCFELKNSEKPGQVAGFLEAPARLFAWALFILSLSVNAQTSPGGVLTSAACRLWVEARDVNGDGNYTNNPAVNTALSTWTDKSGNANDLTQSTASNMPVYNTIAGVPVVKWDNSGTNINFMNVTNQAMLSPGTMYFVLRMVDAGDGGNCLFDRSGGGNTSLRYEQWNGTNFVGFTKYSTADYTSTLASVYGSNVIMSFLKTAASNNLDIALNSSSVALAVGSANPGLPLYVLGKNNTSDGMNGYVLEALAYNTNLNYAQKMIIDNYLSAKYAGIAIISDKYAGDTGGNGNYDYELGGVGTESSGSNNSAASSITGGLGVSQATAMENGEYLMFAHQNGSNTVNTTDVGGMSAGLLPARWERIWYFDWTSAGGNTESVDLTFDFSDGGLTGSAAGATSNYKLLYRAGTSGNWTEVMNASSLSGDRVTFSGLARTQGDGYYTIGSLDINASPLPVELMSFTATPCQSRVCVNWATASERNTDYFRVERSRDGVNWELVNISPAAGTSTFRHDYESTDDFPLMGLSYYRLISIDKDFSSEYSPIVAVINSVETDVMDIFPNPAGDYFQVKFKRPDIFPVAYELASSDGRVVVIFPSELYPEIRFDVTAAARGLYILVATLPNGVQMKKKIILK
jgi:hypothetical protein